MSTSTSMDGAYYETALICERGHVITSILSGSRNAVHCERCGAATLSKCPSCQAPIRGRYEAPGVLVVGGTYEAPAFCYSCGEPYPWTRAREAAALALVAELDELDASEKELLSRSIDELLRDSPQAEAAGLRFKKLARKIGTEGASALRNILVDVLSEAVRKSLFPS